MLGVVYGVKATDVLLQMLNFYIGKKFIAGTDVEMYSNFGLISVNPIMPMPVPTSPGSNASSHGHVNPSDMEASVDATFRKLPSSPKLMSRRLLENAAQLYAKDCGPILYSFNPPRDTLPPPRRA